MRDVVLALALLSLLGIGPHIPAPATLAVLTAAMASLVVFETIHFAEDATGSATNTRPAMNTKARRATGSRGGRPTRWSGSACPEGEGRSAGRLLPGHPVPAGGSANTPSIVHPAFPARRPARPG